MQTTQNNISIAMAGLLLCSSVLRADERDDKIQALEQRLKTQDERIRRLEDLLIKQQEKTAPLPPVAPPEQAGSVAISRDLKDASPAKTNAPPVISIGSDGFVMRSANGNFKLGVGGLLQMDSRSYFNDGGIQNNDMFLIRRARITLDGRVFRDFEFRLQPELGGASAPSLRDAYLNYSYAEEAQLQFGKFKTPVGLEQLQRDRTIMFVERSLVSDITPGRDVGVEFHGTALDKTVEYSAGVYNGVGDGATTSNVDTDGEKSVAGRVFVYPFPSQAPEPFQKIGLGVGGSFARTHGAAEMPSGNGFLTQGQQQFFTYLTSTAAGKPNVVGAGDHWRISPQASWYWRRWSALAEYVLASQDLARSDLGVSSTIQNSAWQVALGCVLTGENASAKGVIPTHPFNPHEGSWGALEVVARLSSLHVDNSAFPLFADPSQSASQAASWAVGLNWYLNENIRAYLDFFQTRFDGGKQAAVTAQDEFALFWRLQLSF